MPTNRRARFLAGALAVPLAVALSGCGNDNKDKDKAQAGSACPTDLSGTASQQLPSDFPGLSDQTLYRFDSQGKTQVWFAAADGGPDDLAKIRDEVNDGLEAKGYEIEGTDQEEGAEAEAEFKGPHTGTINVRPLCTGKVVVRYKLES